VSDDVLFLSLALASPFANHGLSPIPVAPLETIGLFGFAWTSLGPDYGIPWIAPMIFTVLIAIANYGIYKVCCWQPLPHTSKAS
jgi:hypothetical protein